MPALIESENANFKGIRGKPYAWAQLPDGKLRERVDQVSTIGLAVWAETSASS